MKLFLSIWKPAKIEENCLQGKTYGSLIDLQKFLQDNNLIKKFWEPSPRVDHHIFAQAKFKLKLVQKSYWMKCEKSNIWIQWNG